MQRHYDDIALLLNIVITYMCSSIHLRVQTRLELFPMLSAQLEAFASLAHNGYSAHDC